MILWADIETTGLDKNKGSILELALVLTDDDLNELGVFESLVRPLHLRGYEVMDDYARSMHQTSGLLTRIYEDGGRLRDHVPRLGEVEGAACVWLINTAAAAIKDQPVGPALRSTPLAGSSIHFDREWIGHHMGDLLWPLSHRQIDVSTINELALRWAPQFHAGRPGLGPDGRPVSKHRALDDVRASIETLRYYRGALSPASTGEKTAIVRIVAEQARQRAKFPDRHIGTAAAAPLTKLRILVEEVGELAEALDGEDANTPRRVIDELTQVAACAVSWLELLCVDDQRAAR